MPFGSACAIGAAGSMVEGRRGKELCVGDRVLVAQAGASAAEEKQNASVFRNSWVTDDSYLCFLDRDSLRPYLEENGSRKLPARSVK